jgi:hypothetical protein
MKYLIKKRLYIGLFAVFACFLLVNCGNQEKLEDISVLSDAASDSRAEECAVILKGRVVNTKNLQPIAGAEVSSDRFSAKTNANGEFEVSLNFKEDGIIDDVEVRKDGFLVKGFKAYFGSLVKIGSCPLVTNISWNVALSEKQEGVWVGPKEGAWYKIMDTVATEVTNEAGMSEINLRTNMFVVDIRRGSLDDWGRVHVSPNHSTAIGPGIPTEPRSFLFELFQIDVFQQGDGLLSASSRNSLVFNFPIDIRWIPTVTVDVNGLGTIDLEDLGLNEEQVQLGPNGEIIFLTDENGSQGLGNAPVIEEVIEPVIRAIQEEKSIEEINQTLQEGLEEVGNQGGNTTQIITDVESAGRIANSQTLTHCGCPDGPTVVGYTAQLNGTEELIINFPANTSEADRAAATSAAIALIGTSGDPNQNVSINVNLGICEAKQVTSQEIVRTVTGVVNGFSFTYSATDRLETNESDLGCATSTPCHQGC